MNGYGYGIHRHLIGARADLWGSISPPATPMRTRAGASTSPLQAGRHAYNGAKGDELTTFMSAVTRPAPRPPDWPIRQHHEKGARMTDHLPNATAEDERSYALAVLGIASPAPADPSNDTTDALTVLGYRVKDTKEN